MILGRCHVLSVDNKLRSDNHVAVLMNVPSCTRKSSTCHRMPSFPSICTFLQLIGKAICLEEAASRTTDAQQ